MDVLKSFSANGLPEHIISDYGPQFISSEFVDFKSENGVEHICSALYHPSTNGPKEKFVQSLK